jgi:hypothetical protein
MLRAWREQDVGGGYHRGVLLPVQELRCCRCGTVVQSPFLPGEHRYGDFVVHGQLGDVHGYLDVIDGPGQWLWEFVRAIVGDDGLATEVTARVCDEIAGQGLSLELFCPDCHSHQWRACQQGIETGEIETPVATFARFSASSDDVRTAQVNNVARQVRESGLYRARESRHPFWPWRLMDGWRRVEAAGVGALLRRLKAWGLRLCQR